MNCIFKKYNLLLFPVFSLFILPAAWTQISVFHTAQPLEIEAEGDTTLCFGFAEGDEIVLDFEELKGRKLEEIVVSEYPDFEKFVEEKVSKVSDARIKVFKTAVYCFRFSNSLASKSKACNIHIQRIPASGKSAEFVTAVKWLEVLDTVVTDPISVPEVIYGDSIHQSVVILLDTTLWIQPVNDQQRPSPRLSFQIPVKSYSLDRFKLNHTIETSACVYSIDVGAAGAAWYAEANDNAAQAKWPCLSFDKGAIQSYKGRYDALLLMGLTGHFEAPTLEHADSISYFFSGEANAYISRLKKTCSAKSGFLPLNWTKKMHLFLENHYSRQTLEVHVSVLAILLEKFRGKQALATEFERVRTCRVVKKKVPVLAEN